MLVDNTSTLCMSSKEVFGLSPAMDYIAQRTFCKGSCRDRIALKRKGQTAAISNSPLIQARSQGDEVAL